MSTQPPVYLDDDGNEIDPGLGMAKEATRQAANDPMALGEGFLGDTGPATALGVLSAVSPGRAFGAGYGAYKGYRGGSKVAGMPGALAGGLAGGVAGAISPKLGATGAGALSDMASGDVKGAAMNAVASLLLGRFGGGGKKATDIGREVESARTAARIAKEVGKKATPKATEVLPGFDTTQLMQLKAAWANQANRGQIREFVAQQSPEAQKQIKQFLMSNAMR